MKMWLIGTVRWASYGVGNSINTVVKQMCVVMVGVVAIAHSKTGESGEGFGMVTDTNGWVKDQICWTYFEVRYSI